MKKKEMYVKFVLFFETIDKLRITKENHIKFTLNCNFIKYKNMYKSLLYNILIHI